MTEDNVGPVERLISLVSGLGLAAVALRRGTLAGRAAASAAGVLLIARGASAYCPVKGALAGRSSLQEGFREQWGRIRSGAAQEIDSLSALYIAELQELHSAETQLGHFLQGRAASFENDALARQIEGYDTEVHSRRDDLAHLLRASGANPRQHADQAMRALLFETRKVGNVGSPSVREAALLSSLQRVLHFKIAGYGTVATYAKQLGRTEEAAQLGGYADRDKQLDAELTQIAATVVNPQAARRPTASPGEAELGMTGDAETREPGAGSVPGARVGAAAGTGVGAAAGTGIGAAAGTGIGVAAGTGVGAAAGTGVGVAAGAGTGTAGLAGEPQSGRPH